MCNTTKTQNHELLVADSLCFLTNTSFHDAKLVDVLYNGIYGKECLSLLVDFKTALSSPAGGNFYEISFWDGKFIQQPKRMKDCYIISLDCFPIEQLMRTRIELEYFTGGEAHHDVLEIEFSDIKVFKAKYNRG